MDLSRLSNEDLLALKTGRLDGVSTEGLMALKGESASSGSSGGWTQNTPESRVNAFRQQMGNLTAGAVRGAGSIGATIAALYDIPADLLAGKGLTLESNRQRRASMDEALKSLGADPQSLAYQVGKVGGEIAGTAGTGSLLAQGARAAGAAPGIVSALQTSGMAGGNLATRTAAGALTGGAAAGLVNPEEAATGAAIGGALPGATSAVKAGISAGRNMIGGLTGTGGEALRVAYESGKAGGTKAQSFLGNMRGTSNMQDVLDDARQNLSAMREARSLQYRQNMDAIKTDKTVLDMAPIDKTIADTLNKFTFKGQAKNPKVLEAINAVKDEIDAWKQLDPAQFHTAEGLDALKQRIGAVLESVPYDARAVRMAVNDVYKGVWNQIQRQAPTYAKTMKSYEEASGLIDEINRSLSLGENKSADTAMRKLQSVMRNNVNTNYGVRAESVRKLEEQGGKDLVPALAGQTLNEWMPRGLQRTTSPLVSIGAGSLAGFPAAVAAAAGSSPRLMGETAYYAGKASPLLDLLGPALYRSAPVLGAQQ